MGHPGHYCEEGCGYRSDQILFIFLMDKIEKLIQNFKTFRLIKKKKIDLKSVCTVTIYRYHTEVFVSICLFKLNLIITNFSIFRTVLFYYSIIFNLKTILIRIRIHQSEKCHGTCLGCNLKNLLAP